MQAAQDVIEQQVTIAAPRERVWEALTTAEQIRTWWVPEGISVDLRVGGRFTHDWDGKTYRATYVEIDEPRKLAFTWVPGDLERSDVPIEAQNQTLVELSLADSDDGGTILSVRESGFASLTESDRERAFPMNAGGWSETLASLARFLQA